MAVRWHPDKFFQKFGSRVKGSELKQIEEKVKGVFQDVTNILQQWTRGEANQLGTDVFYASWG